jgi:hypothetical protein
VGVAKVAIKLGETIYTAIIETQTAAVERQD